MRKIIKLFVLVGLVAVFSASWAADTVHVPETRAAQCLSNVFKFEVPGAWEKLIQTKGQKFDSSFWTDGSCDLKVNKSASFRAEVINESSDGAPLTIEQEIRVVKYEASRHSRILADSIEVLPNGLLYYKWKPDTSIVDTADENHHIAGYQWTIVNVKNPKIRRSGNFYFAYSLPDEQPELSAQWIQQLEISIRAAELATP